MKSKRVPWLPLGGTILVALLMACSQQAPSTPPKAAEKPAATTPIPTVAAPASSPAAAPKTAASPAAASPAPATKAAASPSPATKTAGSPSPAPATKAASPRAVQTGPRTEPKGKATYVWHIAIAPIYFDPQENPATITQYGFQYALHDAMLKHMPGQPLSPSLAESYEIAPDFKSATFKLRPNLKFHNGDPVTSADVKWTFENYRGASAKLLKDKTASVETPDALTTKFTFKEPFLDFLVLYGTPATGAGWIVPSKYYQQVGPDGFKQNPIGAGPYKLVRQVPGSEFELEAFTDYWRKAPNVKTIIWREVLEPATRLAMIQSGEADFINLVPGPLLDTVKSNPNLRLAPVLSGNFWLEFPGYEKSDSPFNKKQVREAISLAIDRDSLSQVEEGGLSRLTTNWVPEDWPGAIQGTKPPYDVARAKQLLAEAGYPNGFDVEQLTPIPPYSSQGERVITNLREIGVRTKLNTMDRAAFFSKLQEGPTAIPGIILNASGGPGDAAARIRAFATCPPGGNSSRTCDPNIDEPFKKYESSINPQEREQLLTQIQRYMIDNFIFVNVWRQAFISAIGPRIANNPEEIWGAVPQYVYVGPYEDIMLKE